MNNGSQGQVEEGIEQHNNIIIQDEDEDEEELPVPVPVPVPLPVRPALTHQKSSMQLVPDSMQAPGHGKSNDSCVWWHPTHATLQIDNELFHWDARSHRKLRFLKHTAAADGTRTGTCTCTWMHRVKLWSWEPRVITWYNLLIGIVANTLWVVNGLYAVWPNSNATNITYATGLVGAFMFIVTGYLGYIEAINQTYAKLRVPPTTTTTTTTALPATESTPPPSRRGALLPRSRKLHPWRHLIQDELRHRRHHMHPLVQDVETGQLVTGNSLLQQHGTTKDNNNNNKNDDDAASITAGRPLEIVWKDSHGQQQHTLKVTVKDYEVRPLAENQEKEQAAACYRWWTWTPDLHELAIVNSLVFLVATILFFIPAVAWFPMERHGSPSLAGTIFWNYVLQIIPSIGFIYVGYAGMAEACGSWSMNIMMQSQQQQQQQHYTIGWYACLCNALGGLGFLLYPILYLPAVVGEPGCCDELSKWGASFATFWGSCFFWIAGILQWIEFCSPHRIGA